MKKIIIIAALTIFTLNAVTSQIMQKTLPTATKKNVPIKTVPVAPAPAPPPPAKNKSTGTSNQTIPIYSLTAVKATIKTGNDNKEYPSNVRISLGVRGSNMQYAFFLQENLKNEMRSNTNTEFGLEKVSRNYSNTTLKDITLEALQNAGFHCRINYLANFQLDAWRIEGVTIALEFRDQNGNLHPSLGNKTITFSNAIGFLNGYPGTTTMICNTDGYFNPLSAFIE